MGARRVRALKRWAEYEAQPAYTQCVFRNDGKRPLVSEEVWEGFDRIRDAPPETLRKHPDGNKWSFKHRPSVEAHSTKEHGGCLLDKAKSGDMDAQRARVAAEKFAYLP